MDHSSPIYSSSPIANKQVHKVIPSLSKTLKKKDQTHVDRIRKTFSQVKINILLLDSIQQMPLYGRFLKDLYTSKESY